MKKMVFGFILGIALTLSTTGMAAVVEKLTATEATFPVYVNGEKLEGDKPVVVVNGSTYLPLTKVAEALDVNVKWNDNMKRVEVGMPPIDEVKNVQPISTETAPELTAAYENEYYKIELLGSRIGQKEDFPQRHQSTYDLITLKVRYTNKSDFPILVGNKDFKGIYELVTPPDTEQWIFVKDRIKYNKSNVFQEPIEDPGVWKSVELLSFKMGAIAPGEVREGNIVYLATQFNYKWHGLKYNDIELKFEKFHNF